MTDIAFDLPPPAGGTNASSGSSGNTVNIHAATPVPGKNGGVLILSWVALLLAAAALAAACWPREVPAPPPCECANELQTLRNDLRRVERSRIEADSRIRSELRNVAATLPQRCAETAPGDTTP